jgi:hypothetical protein
MPACMSAADQAEVWDRDEDETNKYIRPIAKAIGPSQWPLRAVIAKTGAVRPLVPTEWSDVRLPLAEREEISRGAA